MNFLAGADLILPNWPLFPPSVDYGGIGKFPLPAYATSNSFKIDLNVAPPPGKPEWMGGVCSTGFKAGLERVRSINYYASDALNP